MGVVNVVAGAYGCTNHDYWYQNGAAYIYFAGLTVQLNVFSHDVAANGFEGYVASQDAIYTILSPTSIKINFNAMGKNHPWVAQGFGYGFYFKYLDNPSDISNVIEQPTMSGNNSWRSFPMEIILHLDVSVLGIPMGVFSESTYATIIG